MRKKLLSLLFFVHLFVFLLVGFGLICVFVRSKSFHKKKQKKNWFEIVLMASFTISIQFSTKIKVAIQQEYRYEIPKIMQEGQSYNLVNHAFIIHGVRCSLLGVSKKYCIATSKASRTGRPCMTTLFGTRPKRLCMYCGKTKSHATSTPIYSPLNMNVFTAIFLSNF